MLLFVVLFSTAMALIIGGFSVSALANTRKIHEIGAYIAVLGIIILFILGLTA